MFQVVLEPHHFAGLASAGPTTTVSDKLPGAEMLEARCCLYTHAHAQTVFRALDLAISHILFSPCTVATTLMPLPVPYFPTRQLKPKMRSPWSRFAAAEDSPGYFVMFILKVA